MTEIVHKCACGRRTTLGPKCAWCTVTSDNEDPTISWVSLEEYLECEDYLEEEEN